MAATKRTTGSAEWWSTCRVKRGWVEPERRNVGENLEGADNRLSVSGSPRLKQAN